MGYVYQLVCPIRKEPVYVGATKTSLNGRMVGHLNKIKHSQLPVYTYFRSIGKAPIIEVLEEVPDTNLRAAECNWINSKLKEGVSLLNSVMVKRHDTGSVKVDPEVYKKVSDYCKEHGIKVTFFATQAIAEKLDRVEKSPQTFHESQ